jgi:CheY-like chemotaxis protein
VLSFPSGNPAGVTWFRPGRIYEQGLKVFTNLPIVRMSAYMGPKILILEDDAVTARAYELALKSAECEVKIAPHIEPAMKLCRENWPQVILLDIELPIEDINGIGAWNGFDFLSWVRGMVTNPPPTFVISSHAATSLAKERAMEAGATGYFQKPVDRKTLIKAVYSALNLPPPAVILESVPQFVLKESVLAGDESKGGWFSSLARLCFKRS